MFTPRRRRRTAPAYAVLAVALPLAVAPGPSEPPDDPNNPFCTILGILCPAS